MTVHSTQVLCSRGRTLAYYLTHSHVNVAVDVPDLVAAQPHSVLHGSIESDITHQFSHTHALYGNDNIKQFNLLDEATRGTKWAIMIKPFSRRQDGVGTWKALLSNHAGSDKWDAMIEAAESYVMVKKWDGSGETTLDAHIDVAKVPTLKWRLQLIMFPMRLLVNTPM